MELENTTEKGIVVESYSYDSSHQVVTARCQQGKCRHFFFLPQSPNINFGDILLMDFGQEQFHVHHGNPHLSYRIFPAVFPGTLLLELLLDNLNL